MEDELRLQPNVPFHQPLGARRALWLERRLFPRMSLLLSPRGTDIASSKKVEMTLSTRITYLTTELGGSAGLLTQTRRLLPDGSVFVDYFPAV